MVAYLGRVSDQDMGKVGWYVHRAGLIGRWYVVGVQMGSWYVVKGQGVQCNCVSEWTYK